MSRLEPEPYYEDPETRFKNIIIRMGDVDALQEVDRQVRNITEAESINISALSEGIRIGLTEQPYKVPYFALFLRRLFDCPAKSEGSTAPDASIGRQVLEDFWKGFQGYLDKLAWREVRFCIHFFAHLTVARVISPQSMLSLLQSLTAVLDEFGVSHARAKQAARSAAEGLMRAGKILKEHSAASVIEMITAIQTYSELMPNAKWLVHPASGVNSSDSLAIGSDEILDTAIAALKALDAGDFEEVSSIYVQPYTDVEKGEFDLYDLPSVLVPPDAMELESLGPDVGEDVPIKKEEWPELYLRLFPDEVTPNPTTPAGYAARSDIADIMDIFEINRKECARLLLEYPKWTHLGTFKPRPGGPGDEPDRQPIPGKDWQLESTLVETALSHQFLLPDAPKHTIYYGALITELCKLSPQTVGPAVGKSIRKCYSFLVEGLDVEVGRRFAEWFSVHMSNFNFQWVWKEWIDDLTLPPAHPKKTFIRLALEQEIRLSYYDRIVKTLPPQFQEAEAGAIADQAPGPEYDYELPSAPHYEHAQSVLNQLRARAKPDEVTAVLDTIRDQLNEEGEANADQVVRTITVQSLLHIGSRSFSHFLNAIERYIALLRGLAAGGERAGAKGDVLNAAARFWHRNPQMVSIVFDKFMQYQIVDPTDCVRWVFAHAEHGLDWVILKGAIDKANGRVIVARKRIAALRKEEDETRARELATDSTNMEATNMEVDAEVKTAEPTSESPALSAALKAVSTLSREQKSTLSLVIEGFVDLLHPSDASLPVYSVFSQSAWDERAAWTDNHWVAWSAWGWYKHFCRAYAPYLRTFANTLSIVSLSKIESAEDESAKMMKRVWNAATGQE
ncbi:hypothetical protein PENSPDRAFT_592329 [Peniophora sp. CONT]|nr:hypothetical protein PENSPDRAFT_592329 [Peniophora sp. CONT]